jgi:TatD DNase family protein
MRLIDIHTHNKEPEGVAIYNGATSSLAGRCISIGIHPWHIGTNWEEVFDAITAIANADHVVAIGECGLDNAKTTASPDLQEKVFRAHIALSEKLHKPLIIHCVKAHDRLLALRKESAPAQPWVIHGFRGKPQQAEQLVKAGLYISFGALFNSDSVKAVPKERIFVESDESGLPIEEIYKSIAKAKGISTEELAAQAEENSRIFGIF